MLNETEPAMHRRTPAQARVRAVRVLLAAGVLCCVIGWLVMALYDVESVLVTGPILCLLGFVLIVAGLLMPCLPVAAIGAAHVGISLLFFLLVVTLDWSPGDAELPFAMMGGIYVIAIAPLSRSVGLRIPLSRREGACEQCGYLLYGLSEPRCPECGRPFSPALLGKLKPPPA